MPHPTSLRTLRCAQLDPLVRRHLAMVACVLADAGMMCDPGRLLAHFDPASLERLARSEPSSDVAAFALRYLALLTPAHRVTLASARALLEAELAPELASELAS